MKEQDAAHSFTEGANPGEVAKKLVEGVPKKNPHEEAIKTLAYRCLQWEDGEIKGYDMQMMDSLLPIMMRPLYDRLEQLSKELTRLRSELQQKDEVIKKLIPLAQENAEGICSISESYKRRAQAIVERAKESLKES